MFIDTYYRLDRRPAAYQVAYINGDLSVDTDGAEPLAYSGPCFDATTNYRAKRLTGPLVGQPVTVTVQGSNYQDHTGHSFSITKRGRFGHRIDQYQLRDPGADPEMAAALHCGRRMRRSDVKQSQAHRPLP